MAGRGISRFLRMVAASICLMLPFSGNVQGAPADGGKQGPPQFAIDACKGHREGDSVQTKNPRGETVSGTCQSIDGTLVFAPPGFRGTQGGVGSGGANAGGSPRPPQFAIDACKGHREGDSVQTKNPRGETVSGTCQTIDGTLVFAPPGFRGTQGGGGSGGANAGGSPRPPQEAIDACKGHATGDSVQMKNRRGETVSGTCMVLEGTMAMVPAGKGPLGMGGGR